MSKCPKCSSTDTFVCAVHNVLTCRNCKYDGYSLSLGSDDYCDVTNATHPTHTDDGERKPSSKDVKCFMKSQGFDMVQIVGDTYEYVKDVPEHPPHLTNGKSYWILSRNQAAFLYDMFLARDKAQRQALDEALLEQLYAVGNTFFPSGQSDGSKNAEWLQHRIEQLESKITALHQLTDEDKE